MQMIWCDEKDCEYYVGYGKAGQCSRKRCRLKIQKGTYLYLCHCYLKKRG